MLLLQAAAVVPVFNAASRRRRPVGTRKLDNLSGKSAPVDTILQEISDDRDEACAHLYGYLAGGRDPQPLVHAARLLIFFKGTKSHDYRFSSAAF